LGGGGGGTLSLAGEEVVLCIERLDCKRPILWLASSKILTPHPPLHPASVSSPRTKGGGYTLAGGAGGGGTIFWKTPGTALYSTYVSTLWYSGSLSIYVLCGLHLPEDERRRRWVCWSSPAGGQLVR
jgi:hypothetical protein